MEKLYQLNLLVGGEIEHMELFDWFIVLGFYCVSLGIGLFFTKRASESTEAFFVAGRSLPWWLAGTSIIATSFSSDTPLFVSGLVRRQGLAANWLWISAATGTVAMSFFFAHLWRRSRLLTDLQFLELRYTGRAAASLRIIWAFFYGVLKNCMIMGSVTFAMAKVTTTLVGPGAGSWVPLVLILMALSYSMLSGLLGVVYTDFLQFLGSILGAIMLAGFAIKHVGGLALFQEKMVALSTEKPELTAFVPNGEQGLPWLTFLVYICMLWWIKAPGSGHLVQRLLSTKNEKEATLSGLWYALVHYALRPWPWFIVAFASLLIFPDLTDHESAYPLMIEKLLPSGLKGVMVAAFLAAFMSTIDSHLNWGASYFVNDFYKAFINPEASERALIRVTRISMLALVTLTFVVASVADSIVGIYKFLFVLEVGPALLLILRWYWWRVTVWAEITAYSTAILSSLLVPILIPQWAAPTEGTDPAFAYRILSNVFITTLAWVSVAFYTSSRLGETEKEKLESFVEKIKPPGPGWKQFGGSKTKRKISPWSFIGWLAATVMIYSLLHTIGSLLFGQYTASLISVSLFLFCSALVHLSLKRINTT